MRISNWKVYGLYDSAKAAKYPMAVETGGLNREVTSGIKSLAQCSPGTGHDNWLNGVIVQFDLQATVKFWTEMERYHFIDFVSSQSTMHRIAKFDLDRAYIEYTDARTIEIMKELVERYNETGNKDDYLRCLYSNPCGMMLTARMTTNYRQLKTIYLQRKAHRLPEWRAFCKWIEELPMSELITGIDKDDE